MPKDFLWGAGYAGHQVEGNNIHSQNWKKEIDQHYAERSGLACNSYELWKTDVDLAEQTGLQAFRTSVEWSRIEPEEGHFDQKAADHYVALFAELKSRGIRVFATMVHQTHPQWLKNGDILLSWKTASILNGIWNLSCRRLPPMWISGTCSTNLTCITTKNTFS